MSCVFACLDLLKNIIEHLTLWFWLNIELVFFYFFKI